MERKREADLNYYASAYNSTTQRLRLEHAWICALYKFCNNNNNTSYNYGATDKPEQQNLTKIETKTGFVASYVKSEYELLHTGRDKANIMYWGRVYPSEPTKVYKSFLKFMRHQQQTRCSRRRQTSRLVPPPGELDETYTSPLILVYLLYCEKTRHPENCKYITLCALPSQKYWATATGKFGEISDIRFLRYASKQTNIHWLQYFAPLPGEK